MTTGQATEDFKPNEVNYENEARAQGWRPQEEWTGLPERWVDAETFVTRAQNWSGHLKKELEEMRGLLRQQAALNKKNQESIIQNAKVREQELQQQIAALEQQRAVAISTANGEQAVAAERQIRAATEELAVAQKEAQAPIDPNAAQAAADWRTAHTWYGTNPELTEEADYIGNTYGQMHKDKPLVDILNFVEKEMSHRHPELKGQVQNRPDGPQRGEQASGVRNVQQSDSGSAVKWEDLDSTTQAVADQLIRKRVFKDRKSYLAAAAVDQNEPIRGVKKDDK